MRQDLEQAHDDRVQPQRRQLMMAIAAIAGLSLTMRSPTLLNAGAEALETGRDLLAQLLNALGQQADRSMATTNAAVELQLSSILRAPLSVFASDVSTHDLKQRIRRNIEADYQAGDIRIVDGWWLSATEANCLELIEQVRAG